jgi:hypothetical protein
MLNSSDASAIRCAKHHANWEAALCAAANTRHVLFDLVEGLHGEPRELDFGNWLHAVDRHADRCANDPAFDQWSIHDSVSPVAFLQAAGHAEDAAIDTNVLAH